MISKLKTPIKLIIYFSINILIKPSKEIKPKSILLLRLDAIGDYVLFRNFIEILKNDERYKDYKITLCGNIIWKELAEYLDNNFIEHFIWIDRKKFTKYPFYRLKKLKEITKQGYELVIQPRYSREFFFEDTIVKLVEAKEKIGCTGDPSNIKKWQKKISDKHYTKLVPAKNQIIFEFYRNKEFFESLLGKKINITKTTINLKEKNLTFDLPKKYAILFIGASAEFRKWNVEGFANVGRYLKDKYGYEIVLCGAPSDNEDAMKFKKCFNGSYVDLVGKTSLVDLLYVIYNGNIMIANETLAPHFAVALGMINLFIIYNGNHYGRFTPYPKEVSENYHVIYHPEIENNLDEYIKLSNSYGFGSKLDINEISVERVRKEINKALGTTEL